MKLHTIIAMVTVVIMGLILAFVLVAAVKRVERPEHPRFQVVERFEGGCIWVDTETGIGYGQIYDSNRSLFPIYDVDGTLYRPNGWRDNGE